MKLLGHELRDARKLTSNNNKCNKERFQASLERGKNIYSTYYMPSTFFPPSPYNITISSGKQSKKRSRVSGRGGT